jgi:hypothetical protein
VSDVSPDTASEICPTEKLVEDYLGFGIIFATPRGFYESTIRLQLFFVLVSKLYTDLDESSVYTLY